MFDLSSYNTFKLKVHCEQGRVIKSLEELQQPIADPFIILGGGSDVLFTEDFSGTVLINHMKGLELLETDPSRPDLRRVRVGSGELLDDCIVKLLDLGLNGLENLSLIPGTIGAAPVQNVGAYGVEIGDVIESVEVFDLKEKKSFCIPKDECHFGYRTSIFKERHEKNWFITYVNLALPAQFTPCQNYAGLQSCEFKDALAVRQHVIALRSAKLPNPQHVGNAGSFFKNPHVSAEKIAELKAQYASVPCWLQPDGSYKLAAGWLIDKAGCRGIRHGQAGTWGSQALVIVNLGSALPSEIVALAEYVCAEVKSKFGVALIPEVRFYDKHGEKEWKQI